MHILHRNSLMSLRWNNDVIIKPFCHIIIVCFLWTWYSGSKLGPYRRDAGSHRADASPGCQPTFLTHNAIYIQLGEGAYRRGNSLYDSRLWSAAVEPDGRACAEWTTKSNRTCLYRINKISLKIWRKKCWFGVRFVLFLVKIHLADSMWWAGEYMYMYYHSIIFKMGIIFLASQSVLVVFFCKTLCAKSKKNDIDIHICIYIDRKDIKASIWVSVDIYRYQWYRWYQYAANNLANNVHCKTINNHNFDLGTIILRLRFHP